MEMIFVNEFTIAAVALAIMSVVTISMRLAPFVLFNESRKTPKIVIYLGNVLPTAIIAMLVIYCLRTTNLFANPFGIPEIIACAVVAILQYWKENIIISLVGGTATYMFLIQVVFSV